MSNETQSDKRKDNLTRVQARQLWFTENIDLPGAQQVSNIKCWREGEQSRYFLADWIPAWQSFEVSYYESSALNKVQIVPACHVRRWERA